MHRHNITENYCIKVHGEKKDVCVYAKNAWGYIFVDDGMDIIMIKVVHFYVVIIREYERNFC